MDILSSINMMVILDLVEEALAGNNRPMAKQALVAFASGKDGKLGTVDDKLTPETLEMLKKMIDDGSLDRLVENMHKTGLFEKISKCFCA